MDGDFGNKKSDEPLEEYENIIHTLNKQVQCYKGEHDCLRDEITTLVRENRLLSTKLAITLEVKPSSSCFNISESNYDSRTSIVLENMKSQINVSLKEKESVIELWNNSLNIIEHLEKELYLYQSSNSGFIRKSEHLKIKKSYESKVNELDKQLKESKTCLQNTLRSSKQNLEHKNEELNKILKMQSNTIECVKQLEEELKELQHKQRNLKQSKEKLETTIDEKNLKISELQMTNLQSKNKVNEACLLVEEMLRDKDNSMHKEKLTKDEINKLNDEIHKLNEEIKKLKNETNKLKDQITSLTEENSNNNKVNNEEEALKESYEIKIKLLKADVKNIRIELIGKTTELERLKKSYRILEDDLQMKKINTEMGKEDNQITKLLVLEKNLESTFQKLLLSERKNLQLVSQNEHGKDEYEQQLGRMKNELDACTNEKGILQHNVRKLKNELQISNTKLIQVVGKIDVLQSKVRMMESEMKKEFCVKDAKSEQIIFDKITKADHANNKIFSDLMTQLKAQIEINRRWRKEVPEITGKFEKRHSELKTEIVQLKKLNKQLREQLKEDQIKIIEYEKYLEELQEYFRTLPKDSDSENDKVGKDAVVMDSVVQLFKR